MQSDDVHDLLLSIIQFSVLFVMLNVAHQKKANSY